MHNMCKYKSYYIQYNYTDRDLDQLPAELFFISILFLFEQALRLGVHLDDGVETDLDDGVEFVLSTEDETCFGDGVNIESTFKL